MKSFIETQHAFIQHIKDPQSHPFEGGIEDRRLAIYRELFFNNILGFLSSGFPVLESLYSEQQWKSLARKFFSEHECRSPYFIDISKEFVEYLSSEYVLTESDPVFMCELAHYEWLELDLSVRKTTQTVKAWDGQSQITEVCMSDLATLVSYHYPVHQISSDFYPTEAGEVVYLVVYRDSSDEVNFTLINAVSAHLLNTILQQGVVSVNSLNKIMIAAMPQVESQQIIESIQQVLQTLLDKEILFPANESTLIA
ncbi:putative DNA-binding domain-containing protein [uncultured Paraglaciecola sp.]|uniref:HvfC family RiPP maturation protein n=1 Tax=uncultured Paraglaciecola sp. TaxID=1765024 RepID=UPI0030DAA7DA|tara:strand:+ start:96236 stop:96997 length:762 start_codon:yes stop_codon:yes gene_type:complete